MKSRLHDVAPPVPASCPPSPWPGALWPQPANTTNPRPSRSAAGGCGRRGTANGRSPSASLHRNHLRAAKKRCSRPALMRLNGIAVGRSTLVKQGQIDCGSLPSLPSAPQSEEGAAARSGRPRMQWRRTPMRIAPSRARWGDHDHIHRTSLALGLRRPSCTICSMLTPGVARALRRDAP